ncbi:MAG: polysaccharide biosynthesis protein PslG [Actinomycetota bacterium]|nr:polysaccharide biosynthesis protein PslG [Actinomycetota bacterium]
MKFKRFIAALTIVTSSSVVGLAAPSTATAATRPLPAFGVQVHALWEFSDAQRQEIFDKLAAAGVTWVRMDFGWCSLQENARGQYSQWFIDNADKAVNEARADGLKVLMTMWCTPGWANGMTSSGWRTASIVPPTDPADYAAAALWAARHFAGRVAAWEVWNEPNQTAFWSGTAGDYVRLLKLAYPAFKEGDPSTKVVFGGPSYNDIDWIRKCYDAGAKGSFDVMATHPYTAPSNVGPSVDNNDIWSFPYAAQVHQLMVNRGDGDTPIWFTEFGWSTHANTGNEANWNIGVTRQQQADFLVGSVKYVQENMPYVTNLIAYESNDENSGDVMLDNYGILTQDDSAKPAYTALKELLTSGSNPTPTPQPSVTSPAPEPSVSSPAPEPSVSSPSPDPTATPSPDGSPTEEPSPEPSATDVPSPEPSPSATPPSQDPGNLLVNGGFESGTRGWDASGGVLTVVHAAHSGSDAGRVSGRGSRASLAARRVAVGSRRTWFGASGYVLTDRVENVKFVIVEWSHGKKVGREVITKRVEGGAWNEMPQIYYRSHGASHLVLRIKAPIHRGRSFLVDDVALRRV